MYIIIPVGYAVSNIDSLFDVNFIWVKIPCQRRTFYASVVILCNVTVVELLNMTSQILTVITLP